MNPVLGRRMSWVALFVLVFVFAASACSSSSRGAPFTPTTPVADTCGMLALPDVQALVTGAPAGTPLAPGDDADVWSRACAWQASGMALVLMVEGASTASGNLVLGTTVELTSNSTSQATPVSGVGDKAVYLVNAGLGQILNAKQGSEVVSVQVSGFPQPVPESSLQPLALEALGKL